MNLRRIGRLRILEALCDSANLSRADLVQRTGLSRSTVSSVVCDLIGEGLVNEQPADTTETRLGRPAFTFSLQPQAGYAVGVEIGHQHVRTILSDLVGTPVWDNTVGVDVDDAAEHTLKTATTLLGRAFDETGIARSTVLGVGVGIACPVDRHSGELSAEGIMRNWVGVKLGDEFAARTGLPVQVINDANACVLAERCYGAAQIWDDVVYLRLSAGIGAGFVCDGRMLLGHAGLSGELGHVTVEPNGIVCRCGNRGCLETVASPTAIADLLSRSWGQTVTSADLAELIEKRNSGAVRAVEDAAGAIGRALAQTVMTLNPRLVLIGGELAVAGDALLNPLRRAIQRETVGSHNRRLEISIGSLGDTAAVRGAAALILSAAPQRLSDRTSTRA